MHMTVESKFQTIANNEGPRKVRGELNIYSKRTRLQSCIWLWKIGMLPWGYLTNYSVQPYGFIGDERKWCAWIGNAASCHVFLLAGMRISNRRNEIVNIRMHRMPNK
ncbi:hypothetical protein K469DRAFT_3308 [Zopfia rhizophila CBS 207.26]|uniref:Uncharacterized protein n=1 Tax=Zopfia rhizophila CBS 207.26 TaxID=1314779 RepID=A0A6A6EWD4_9PEZI|nr:hypothetical protein K469DRAFT_3308 [Zopfia rhizophila CBS 207.26]